MDHEDRQARPRPCPVCGYDCAGADHSVCPECGATLELVLDSPGRFRPTGLQWLLVAFAALALWVALVVSVLGHEVELERAAAREANLKQHSADLLEYRTELQRWWMELKEGGNPGLIMPMPRETPPTYPSAGQLWLGALRGATGMLAVSTVPLMCVVHLCTVGLLGRRQPMRADVARITRRIVFLYVFVLFLFAAVAIRGALWS